METKDIIAIAGLIVASLPAATGIYKLFKDVSWFLPKATKYSHLLANYSNYLDPIEKVFVVEEIKREVKKSVLRVSDTKIRHLVLYIRTNSELRMPEWRWAHLAPHIRKKYNKFFIVYKGKYNRYRLFSKLAAVFYVIFGLVFPSTLLKEGPGLMVLGIVLMLSCLYMARTFWTLFPGRKKVNEYNAQLLRINANNDFAE
ncbi:hypothetical protein RJ498_003595 [Pluralibacter gergoviae]